MGKLSRNAICVTISVLFITICQIAYSTDALNRKLSACDSYEAYESCAQEIKGLIDKNPKGKDVDKLYYLMAETRIEELAFLAKENDIESVRRYMNVSNKYFDEAAMMLDNASKTTSSKSLKIDVLFSKFLIFKEKFKEQRTSILFDEMASEIISFSNDISKNKKELDRVSEKFYEKGLEEDALLLKVLYAKKVGHEGARQIAGELKTEADQAFLEGDFKKANIVYGQYLILSAGVINESELSDRMLDIADKYFDKRQYGEALRYYDDYMTKYRSMGKADYASYKTAECLYAITRYDAAVSQLEAFLNLYSSSKWFNEGFKSLCELYYKNSNIEQGIDKIKDLLRVYPTASACDYAELIIGFLYYGEGKYDNAIEYFNNVKNNYPDTSYLYAADKLLEDINNIKRTGDSPAHGSTSEDTYKAWNPYTQPSVKITPTVLSGGKGDVKKNPKSSNSIMKAAKKILDTEEAHAEEDENYSGFAKITDVKGNVSILPKGEKQWIPGSKGLSIQGGTKIKTSTLSSCEITLDNDRQNVFVVLESSEVIVLLEAEDKMEIIDAHVFARMNSIPEGSTFKVRTPTAVCGIRGTGLGVDADINSMQATTYENTISVMNNMGEEKSVEEGFQRVVDKDGSISEPVVADEKNVEKFKSWPVSLVVSPGAEIKLTLSHIKDLDRFGEYLYDPGDRSRLPKKVEDTTEEDLLSIKWTSTGGRFKDGKQTTERIWKAPNEPGDYTISVDVKDLGLVRPPNEGLKKDKYLGPTVVVITVE